MFYEWPRLLVFKTQLTLSIISSNRHGVTPTCYIGIIRTILKHQPTNFRIAKADVVTHDLRQDSQKLSYFFQNDATERYRVEARISSSNSIEWLLRATTSTSAASCRDCGLKIWSNPQRKGALSPVLTGFTRRSSKTCWERSVVNRSGKRQYQALERKRNATSYDVCQEYQDPAYVRQVRLLVEEDMVQSYKSNLFSAVNQ